MGLTATVDAAAVARRFRLAGAVRGLAPFPGGHINDSYRVDTDRASYLLQRLNPAVFPRAELVMDNVARVTRHIAARVRAAGTADWVRRAPMLVPTTEGADWLVDESGAAWRLFGFVTGAVVKERVESPADTRTAGRAFGEFLRLLADYAGPPLHETIPGFHDTAARFARMEAALRADLAGRAAEARPETDAVFEHRNLAAVLPPLLGGPDVPVRIVHNDAKIANVLLDARSGEALCVVDLDTVMPGTALHDFGDMVRSMTSPTPEDEPDLDRVGVRPDLFAGLVEGYLGAAGPELTARERDLLVFGGRLITLEQAVRFLTDHLEGDRYYRVTRPGQNLARARTQIRLFQTLSAREEELAAIVRRSLP